MRSWREDPEGPENTEASKQARREEFALRMQDAHRVETPDACGWLFTAPVSRRPLKPHEED